MKQKTIKEQRLIERKTREIHWFTRKYLEDTENLKFLSHHISPDQIIRLLAALTIWGDMKLKITWEEP